MATIAVLTSGESGADSLTDINNNFDAINDELVAISGFQQPSSGSINGSNTVFTWAKAPNVLMIDRVPTQKTSSDGTVNWTGTTTTTLTTAPFDDLFAVA